VLDSSASGEEGAGDSADEVASRFGGLIIVSAREDLSWLGVGELLACPPPANACAHPVGDAQSCKLALHDLVGV
jgi:hypothetical protein